MTTDLKMPPSQKYRLTIVEPGDRKQQRLGRQWITFEDGIAQYRQRRATGPIVETLTVVAVERPARNTIELHAEDGTIWRIASCGCGG